MAKYTTMSTMRDSQGDESTLIPPVRLERSSRSHLKTDGLPEDNGFVYQKRNTENLPHTNLRRLEDQAHQTFEPEDCPDLAAIANQLRETSSHAINPSFTETLCENLLRQFVAYHTAETKPIEKRNIPSSHQNDREYESFLYRVCKYIKCLLKLLYRPSRKKPLLIKVWFR